MGGAMPTTMAGGPGGAQGDQRLRMMRAGTPGAAGGPANAGARAAAVPGSVPPSSGAPVTASPGAGAPGRASSELPVIGVAKKFSQRELDAAKLPAAADADNQLEVLLRPGLLADVEIILEKIPSALNIPNTAVFEKDGNQIVYVRKGTAWEERVIKPLKRSETVMVIASGLKPGEVIAISDPTVKPGDKKKEKGGGGAVGSMPGGGRS